MLKEATQRSAVQVLYACPAHPSLSLVEIARCVQNVGGLFNTSEDSSVWLEQLTKPQRVAGSTPALLHQPITLAW